jgi:transcriptional regulator with XRE-family HTH domain
MPYGERLKEYRLARKMSQEELAEQTGVPVTAISKIEHGTRKVTLDEAVRFAEVLQISLGQLAGLDDTVPMAQRETYLPMSRCVKKGAKALDELVSAFQELNSLVAH